MKPKAPSQAEIDAVKAALHESVGPLERVAVCAATGLCDRAVREAIHELVSRGEPIVTDRLGGGYEYTRDPVKLEAEHARLLSQAAKIGARARALEIHLPEQRSLGL